MFEEQVLQGRLLTPDHLNEIRDLITSHPDSSRRHLSRLLAERWKWHSASGQLKDMAARTLMLKLHQRGLIPLPQRRRVVPQRRPWIFDTSFVPELIQEPLPSLRPLHITPVNRGSPQISAFSRYLARYHYLGYHGPVGENIAYQVQDRLGRDLACVLFGAAAWKVAPRDLWIGWSSQRQAQALGLITNNTRFLILPWVRVPHLASHILALVIRRLSSDWQTKYGHPIHLVETFVEKNRFKGTCYRAANWICVGQTQGRGRQDRLSTFSQPIKDIYLYPLTPDFRKELCHADA